VCERAPRGLFCNFFIAAANPVALALSLGVCVILTLLSSFSSPAMEPKFPHFVRADHSDPIRHWANLEGKSDSMRDDLYREHAAADVPAPTKKKSLRFATLVEVAIATLELWWQRRS
jgi:hypothetical protein